MKNYIFIFLFLCFPLALLSENIKGKVVNEQNEILQGASLYWEGTTVGVSTNEFGEFELDRHSNSQKLIVSFIGYKKDTIEITQQNYYQVTLVSKQDLEEVFVKAKYNNTFISEVSPLKVESITSGELKKAACCDLAGCFETQTTVQSKTTNVITNSKELRILGLSGVYNQILIDGLPMIQGLSYTYGISSYPGTIVKSIYVAKGSNSVLQGYESISGQINVVTKYPENADKLFINLYLNSFLEKQLNVSTAFKKNKLSNYFAFHTTQPANKIDQDNDKFLDLPLLSRYSIFNKLKYGNENEFGWHSFVNLRFVTENRVGGQTFFDKVADKGTTNAYGQVVNFYQPDVSGKTGYRINVDNDISLSYSALYQDQESFFGTTNYVAVQFSLYLNLQHNWNYGKTHNLKSGLSYRYNKLNEDVLFTEPDLTRDYNGSYLKEEHISGVFLENTFNWFDDKLSWIAGVRADYHNQFDIKISPRSLLKYTPFQNLTFRANVGKGWRTVNVFSENINLLISSRNIVFNEVLEPEEALNYGLNITYKFQEDVFSGYLTTDFYRTEFQNQIFPDYDSDPTLFIIENFTGTSISNGFQIDGNIKFLDQLEIKAGYNYLDVYRIENGQKVVLPFIAKDRVLFGVSYNTKNEKVQFDINAHWFGQQKLPDTKSNPAEYQRADYSKTYSLLNSQLTYTHNKTEIYFGCENILNTRQSKPIIAWKDPFGQYFDTSSVWGQVKGREFYLGVRYSL